MASKSSAKKSVATNNNQDEAVDDQIIARRTRAQLSQLQSKLSERGEICLDEVWREQEKIFNQKTLSIREQGLDVAITKAISEILSDTIRREKDVSGLYAFSEYSSALSHRYGKRNQSSNQSESRGVQWALLGRHASLVCGQLFGLETLMGPMDRKIKERVHTARQRVVRETNLEVVSAKIINESDQVEDEATTSRVHNLKNAVQKMTQELSQSQGRAEPDRMNKKINVLQLLIDPKDCVQTIENLFDFSFLVKEKCVVFNDKNSTPEAFFVDPDDYYGDDEVENKQIVMSNNMKTLKELSKLLDTVTTLQRRNGNDIEYPSLHREDEYAHQDEIFGAIHRQDKGEKRSRSHNDDDNDIDNNNSKSSKSNGKTMSSPLKKKKKSNS